MSHYVVAVIHRADQKVDDLLAPYEEGAENNKANYWDWYEIGGRWKGMIKQKDGKRVDVAPIGSIDMTMDQDTYEQALNFWDVAIDQKDELKKPDVDYFTLHKPEYFKEYFGDRETYAKDRASFSSYAVITPDGKWHAKGEMGWFGYSSETPDDAKEWRDNWQKRWIDEQDPELIMTIVDCHI